MGFLTYYIDFKNFELKDLRIELKRMQSEPEDTLRELQGGDPVALLETVDQDEDKTKSVRGRRLGITFNSDDTNPFELKNADTFAEDDINYQGRIIMDDLSVPFIGTLVQDDISEAFQPRPNPVRLICGDGFGALKQIELTESDGDIPRGHYRIIDYIYLCLRHINYDELPIFVAFNLYEVDTDPLTSHAFNDQYLDALTFETDVNKRDDCFTVLEKILDGFGCFITFDNSAYYIIRWDEWDDSTGSVTTLRFAEFTFDATFVGYDTLDVDRTIVQDTDPDYEGHYLSFDSAQKRYQLKIQNLIHTYKFEQPKEIPCNSAFLRGTIITDTPTLKTYDPECWTFHKGPPDVTNDGDSYIRVILAGGIETDRFFVFSVQPTNLQYYIESQQIPVKQFDKFSLSVDIKHDGQVETGSGPGNYNVMQVRFYAENGDHYTFHPPEPTDELAYWELSDPTWTTNNRYFKRFHDGADDDTIWNSVGIDFEAMTTAVPDNGHITILLHQTKKPDEFETHFGNLRFVIYPFINGTYAILNSQQYTRTGNQSNKTLEKQFFIGEMPHPLLKGALKKFVGGGGINYFPTESWQNFNDIFVLSDVGGTLGRFLLFQWWNQFKRTRTVIESDIQGLTDNIPSLIFRWKIKHGGQQNKYFMLTSIREMNFGNCGWVGVFVETSYSAGDRSYEGAGDETITNFKYIQ